MTTLTKRMAEDLTSYLKEVGIRVRYLHSDIDTFERAKIIRDMRLDVFDVLIGINVILHHFPEGVNGDIETALLSKNENPRREFANSLHFVYNGVVT